jgi:hypothetical protein
MDKATALRIINTITEESARMGFGKIFIEMTVLKGIATNMQVETKRSVNINQ